MKKHVLAAVLTLSFATPAFANQCPAIMAQIEEAMKTATVDEATKAKVQELYDKGKAEHESGSHDASVATLNEALKLLGVAVN